MLGMLIKDIRLIKNQGLRTFLIIGGMGLLLMTSSVVDAYMLVTYITIIGFIYTLNTLSFDAYDNGYSFMFTLPINARIYVVEKYLFSAAVTFAGCMISGVVVGIYNGSLGDIEHWIKCISTNMSIFWMIMFSIPINLKFGVEKGRVMIFAMAMGIVAGVYLLSLVSRDSVMAVLYNIMEFVDNMNGKQLIVAGGIATLAALAVSMGVSIHVMDRKEF